MKKRLFSIFWIATFLLAGCSLREGVRLENGCLLVEGEPYTVVGMNWSCYPIGTNYEFKIWEQPDSVVEATLDYEMGLLKDMGVNTVRIYDGIPARWVKWIWENHGIRTIVNCTQGRYGMELNSVWEAHVDYANPHVTSILEEEARQMALKYRGTPGLLCYLLGNENNYGLFWDGPESENIPTPDSLSVERATAMYQCLNSSAVAIKAVDSSVPVAIANGDVLFLDIFEKFCPDIDIFGLNTYRGPSFTDLFDQVQRECSKPLLLTEFGSDAYNVLTQAEDEDAQANILLANWQEIIAECEAGRCLGGFTFQFSDEWWKHGQDVRLYVHDTEPSWHNGGYAFDYVKGQENMNEEWFGICAKAPSTSSSRLYDLAPRKAYYLLKDLYSGGSVTSGDSAEASYIR